MYAQFFLVLAFLTAGMMISMMFARRPGSESEHSRPPVVDREARRFMPMSMVRASIVGVATIAAAGCGSAGAPSSAPGTPAATSADTQNSAQDARTELLVKSSIADSTVIDSPIDWVAEIQGEMASDPIQHVDFLIDGVTLWTERNNPYVFNDDGNFLVPSVLTPGEHVLSIVAVTASGANKTTEDIKVTTSRASVPAELVGKTFAYDHHDSAPCSSCDWPSGTWQMEFGEDGVIRIDDPEGGHATEAFEASEDGSIQLFGPTNWIVPEQAQGGFCEAEGVTTMQWELVPGGLTLSGDTADPCASRATMFTGTWTPSS